RHLLELINEVLDVTGIESGRLRLALEAVPVSDVVREATELIGPIAAQRNVVVRAEDAASWERHVLADRQRLKQVLLNLLANAVKYNRENGSVEVTCYATSADRLRIAVADTGLGIPADRIGRL